MTAGEQLVSLSGLSGVSAGQHLLGVTTGGVSEIVFAPWMEVRVTSAFDFVQVEEARAYVFVAPELAETADVKAEELTVRVSGGYDELYVVEEPV